MTWPIFLFAVAFAGGPGLREGALLQLANARGDTGKIADADKLLLEATQLHFSKLNDEELCSRFVRVISWRSFLRDRGSAADPASVEGHLREMLRRGGPVVEKALQAQVERQTKAMQSGKPDHDGQPYNLEVLTVLRRSQGQPDPVRIEVNGESKLNFDVVRALSAIGPAGVLAAPKIIDRLDTDFRFYVDININSSLGICIIANIIIQ